MNGFHWWELVFYGFCLTTMIQLAYYWFFFARLAFYRKPEADKSRQQPVSVIICARDEARNLAMNLPGILVQEYPSSHEIIVVDDNSFDESRYLLEELKKTFKDLHIIELKQEALLIPGKKYPLSVGIKSSRHEILLLTDADCVPATEHWITKMQEGFAEGIEIVLGYGAYHKKKGWLNKLVRMETLHSAMQYLSYALAGRAYMGVGRNLAYRKELFFRHKGFSAHNHVPGGDDDLFINMAARPGNTAIVVDPESFTLSQPAGTWRQWRRQKSRHYSTAKYYKPSHQWLLGLYALSQFLFYPMMVCSILFYPLWWIPVSVAGLRLISQLAVGYGVAKKLGECDLWAWFWLWDLWTLFYYLIFAPSLWRKPRQSWK